jgi:putative transposase
MLSAYCVAVKIVQRPEEYAWTSYHCNARGDQDPLISKHEYYLDLGRSDEQRRCNYRELFREALSPVYIHAIRKATHYSMPLGSDNKCSRSNVDQAESWVMRIAAVHPTN